MTAKMSIENVVNFSGNLGPNDILVQLIAKVTDESAKVLCFYTLLKLFCTLHLCEANIAFIWKLQYWKNSTSNS